MGDRKCVPVKALEIWVLSPEIKTTRSLAVGSLTLFISLAHPVILTPPPSFLFPPHINGDLSTIFKNLVSKSFKK